MDEGEARTILGLTASATPDDVRAAYRRLVRANHPDLTADPGATVRTARITEAYAVLQAGSAREPAVPGPPPPAARAGPAAPPPAVDTVDAGTLAVHAPPDETFLVLLEAAHRVGDVTHIGRGDALLEALVTVDHGRICSLVISLQGRSDGTTEAFCTLTPFDGKPAPPIAGVLRDLVASIRAR